MIYYSKIIDAEFEELTDEPPTPPVVKRSKLCLAINITLLLLDLRLLWVALS